MARIVHLANFVSPTSGGLRTMMLRLAEGYHRAGHEVHLVVPQHPRSMWQVPFAAVHALPSVGLPRSGGYRLVLPNSAVRSTLDTIQPDIVELSDRLTLTSAGTWAREHGIPTTFFAHERIDGVLERHLAGLPGLSRRPRAEPGRTRSGALARPSRVIADLMNRRMLDIADSVVATTRFAAEEFTRLGASTHHVPLGVDSDEFLPRVGPRDDSDTVRLVMCSRLSREKAPELPIRVMRTAARQGRRWHLTVLGDGPMLPHLRRMASGLPVTFLGFVHERDEVAHWLRGADALLAPGPVETFGLAALEAMACGTPVVCRQESALPEVVTDAGFSVGENPADWVKAIDRISHPSGTPLRQRARDRALALPWSRTIHALLSHHGLEAAPGHLSHMPVVTYRDADWAA